MLTRSWRILVVSLASLVIVGCGQIFVGRTIPTLGQFESYMTDIPSISYTLEPNESLVTWYDLSTAQGEAIYFVISAGDLRLRTPSATTFASSSTGYYFASGESGIELVSSSRASELTPENVGAVRTSCIGPCIIIDSSQAAAIQTGYVRITNPFTTELEGDLYVFSKEFDDSADPGNDTLAGAPWLDSGANTSAIETIGDIDVFQVPQDGQLTVFAPPVPVGGLSTDPFAIEAEILDSSGNPVDFAGQTNPVILDPGEANTFTSLISGDFVRVRALNGRAASAEYSTFDISYSPSP